MSKKLAVVDADTLIFRSAAVTENRSVIVKHLKSGRTKEYENRTAFKQEMLQKGYEIKDQEFEYKDVQQAEPIANTLHLVKSQTENILDQFMDHEIIFCAGDKNNFRLDLNLPVQYKNNRSAMLRPVNLSEAKEYFIKKFNAVQADGYEVDDLVSILAYENLAKGYDVTIMSPDKDAKSSDGCKLFDYTDFNKPIVEIKEFHEVKLDSKKKFKSYGIPWLCFQWISGDPSDGFSAKQLAGIKFGDIAAYQTFSTCGNAKDCLIVTRDWFQNAFGDSFTYVDFRGCTISSNWKDIMQLYYKCCRMKRSKDDPLDYKELFDKYGVTL